MPAVFAVIRAARCDPSSGDGIAGSDVATGSTMPVPEAPAGALGSEPPVVGPGPVTAVSGSPAGVSLPLASRSIMAVHATRAAGGLVAVETHGVSGPSLLRMASGLSFLA